MLIHRYLKKKKNIIKCILKFLHKLNIIDGHSYILSTLEKAI